VATRFYFPAEGSGTPNISPAADSGWEQTGQMTRLKLLDKRSLSTLSTLADTSTRTVPITTTQDIVCNQFISGPIPPQLIDTSCTFSMVIRVLESALTANVTLAVVVRVLSSDGGTIRGTLFSSFSSDTEFAATAATRIVSATAVTAVTTQPGDVLCIEVGGHAAGPTAGTTYTMRQGTSASTDFALTTALTTDLNPWCEFSRNLYPSLNNNYQFMKAGDGISVSEKIR
jgi:hypothetical protein